MPTYTIHPEKPYRRFSIYKDDRLLALVKFPSIWSGKAEVTLGDKTYRFLPSGWWWKDTRLMQGDKVVSTLQANALKSALVFKGEGPTGWFAIKRRGFFSQGFNLLNAKDAIVAEVIPPFGRKTSYNLTVTDKFIDSFESHIGLLMLVHHCNVTVRAESSGW